MSDHFDTYSLYIEIIKEKLAKKFPDAINLLTRKNLKKLIMTCGYGIGKASALAEFKVTLKDLNYSEKERSKLLTCFNEIYTILASNYVEDNYLYKKTHKEFKAIIDYTKEVRGFDICMPQLYYKPRIKDLEYSFDKQKTKRLSVSFQLKVTANNTADLPQTERACLVNIIHLLDASYLRHIVRNYAISKTPILVIHDGFGVPFYEVSSLLFFANKAFNINEDLNIFYKINKEYAIIQSSTIVI